MLLDPKVLNIVKGRFNNLQEKVKIMAFTQEFECQFCHENRTLNEEIASVSDKIELEVYDFQKNPLEVERYHIDQIPATIIMGDKDYGVRFYGMPGGYEINSFLNTIIMVSRRESGLSAESKKRLSSWKKPGRIRVLTTLTCPYCSQAVETAHKLAFENEFITSEMIDISEFPHLANKYQVLSVPKIIINETVQFEGAIPESLFIDRLWQA